MKARWGTLCAKCETIIQPGDPIKAQYKRAGFDQSSGKPIWVRVPKAYVHAPRCPKVTPNRPGRVPVGVDPHTGEILVSHSAPSPQGSLFSD